VTITARVLPPAEWLRILAEQPESPLAGQFQANGIPDADSARICVVERDGVIVGSWMIFMAYHAEPVYVNPDARTPSVIKALLEQTVTTLRAEGITHAFALIADVDLLENAPMAHHLGFQKAPGELYFVRVPKE
jgi:L-amino acid N-acyltransferase YncA